MLESAMLSQPIIDKISDEMKRAAIISTKLPETEIAAWFFNASDGPQFFVGEPRAALSPSYKLQPLFYSPRWEGQKPVAWRIAPGDLITPDRSLYRDDIDWRPLYLAR